MFFVEKSRDSLKDRFGPEVPPYLRSPEAARRSGHTSGVTLRVNMAAAHRTTGTRTLFRNLLSRCRTPAQTRTAPDPRRCLSSLPPPPGTWSSELSTLSHRDLYRLSVTDPDRFWGSAAADRLRWMKPFNRVRDCELRSGKISWFLGGKLNVSGTCPITFIDCQKFRSDELKESNGGKKVICKSISKYIQSTNSQSE